ncbi:MAG TPA: DUF3465 domain-containing protein [Gemmatimonadaceae bacterium]|nr:DUF3465 domain-containing protein [Gemmatimonadaceae bacterium]
MRKLWIPVVLIAAVALFTYGRRDVTYSSHAPSAESAGHDSYATAFDKQDGNTQVQGWGTITKVLSDDNDGSRHQRFIVRLTSGQTVLIAHNIDLAPRVSSLRVGDEITFNGEYEWNQKGGVVHRTHRDPDGRHPTGWIKRNGQLFQ